MDDIVIVDERADAKRVLGPDWEQVHIAALKVGVDFDTFVQTTTAKLDAMEGEQRALIDAFETTFPAEVWPGISNALAVYHQIENCRRGLMSAMDAGLLQGQQAQMVADLFGSLSNSTNGFVNATITSLIGVQLLGYDEPTVIEKILTPFNVIMEKTRAIFDMLGEANIAFVQDIRERLEAQSRAAVEGENTVPAVVH